MKEILKRTLIIFIIICILVPSLFSGFVLGANGKLNTERAGNFAANFAINFYENWSSINVVEGKAEGDKTYSASYNGNYDLIWPVENISVSSAFGPRWGSTHGGMDIALPKGTQVYSSSDGTVFNVYSGCTHNYGKELGTDTCGGGFGNNIKIDTENGIGIIYAHLTDVNVKVGDKVKKGQLIGTIGSTGNSTGDHLHLEFITNNIAGLDSTQYIARSGGAINGYSYSVDPEHYISKDATITAGENIKPGVSHTIRGEISTEYDETATFSDIEEGKTPYKFNNKSWIEFIYKNSLKSLKDDTIVAGTSLNLALFDDRNSPVFNKDIQKDTHIIDAPALMSQGKILPGDVLYIDNGQGGGEFVLYVGGTKIIYATPPTSVNSANSTNKPSALRYEYYQYYEKRIKDKLLEGHEDDENYVLAEYGVTKIYRLKKEIAEQIEEEQANLIFNGKGYYSYTKYEGTPTEITLHKSQNLFGLLFSKLSQLLDFLINLIVYMIRMQIVGWANIIENVVQRTVLGISGDNSTTGIVDSVFGTSATSSSGDRITVESIFFNKIPILDANFFNFETAGGHSFLIETNEVDKDGNVIKIADEGNVVYILRKNLQMWYSIIRNLSIALLLFVLIYLGIRIAITVSSEKKAEFKKMLISWGTAMCVVLFIHIFMYMVFVVNDMLVEMCNNIGTSIASEDINNDYEAAQDTGVSEELNLYDAVRTKAYAFDRREGIPATIVYLYLIYLLIRFLLIYLKRYLTIYLLALSGSFMGVKYALDRIAGKKTTSLNKWLKDFSFNVLLQTVHAFIYVLFIGVAFSVSQTSIPGTFIALFLLNFMLKADKIIVKIFGLDKAGSLAEVNNPESFKKLLHNFMPIYTIGRAGFNLGRGLYGRTVRPIFLAATGKDTLKDAEKVLEAKKYERIGSRARLAYNIKQKISDSAFAKKAKKLPFISGAINLAANSAPIRNLKRNNEYKRMLGNGLSSEMNKKLYSEIKNYKKLKTQRFTRSISTVKDFALGTAGMVAAIPVFIAEPTAGILVYDKAKKTIDKHRTMNRAMRKNSKYTGTKKQAKELKEKAKNNYNNQLKLFTNNEFNYQKEIQELKDKMASATTTADKNRFANQIKAKEEARKMEKAKELQVLQENYEKMYQTKVEYGNAKHSKGAINKVLTAVGTVTGATVMEDMAKNDAKEAYKLNDKISKQDSKLKDVKKVAELEMELRSLNKQLKVEQRRYAASKGISEEDSNEMLRNELDNTIKEAKGMNIRTSNINQAVKEYLYENNTDKITGNDIDNILNKVQESMTRVGKNIQFTDSDKAEVKAQLERKMIDDYKGYGLDAKDATTTIRKALGSSGVLEPQSINSIEDATIRDLHKQILQKIKDINTYDEIGKVKYKESLIKLNKILKDVRK